MVDTFEIGSFVFGAIDVFLLIYGTWKRRQSREESWVDGLKAFYNLPSGEREAAHRRMLEREAVFWWTATLLYFGVGFGVGIAISQLLSPSPPPVSYVLVGLSAVGLGMAATGAIVLRRLLRTR